jgi:tRNA/rRNA methyltransferase
LYVNATEDFKNIRIVLCGTTHPGNIGSAARAMRTMGLTQLVLVNPERFPDPQAGWMASHATGVLESATICTTLDEALQGVGFAIACTARVRELSLPLLDARQAAGELLRAAAGAPVALVFGNETYGLSNDEVGRCHRVAGIPADPAYSSLNLAAAVQVFCYELRMAAGAGLGAEKPRALAAHDDVERFYASLEQSLVETGFIDPDYPKKLMPRMRRLFNRAVLEVEEVNILRGILKALTRSSEKYK